MPENKSNNLIPQEDINKQLEFIDFVNHRNIKIKEEKCTQPKAFTQTFGCQQNEADTQRISGMLHQMGYEMTNESSEADVIVVNTCAVREHAEKRVLGIVGEFSHLKKNNPNLIIALCGCMVQQEHMAEKVRKSYPFVDLVFGTHAIWRFPELLCNTISSKHRVFDISGDEKGAIAEGLPVLRDGSSRAWLSIMYGCNNFCSYCIVPYVRGRERSRAPEVIEAELKQLVAQGYKDITLLGQNVNSYGKDLTEKCDFAELLVRLNSVEGDFKLRFMTSHPKDASYKLFDTMANCPKVACQLHLPFQSGSNRILKEMNRGYTIEQYVDLIEYARKKMPEITLSSDIIVGFPGETEEDFIQTLMLVKQIEFDTLYTFLYSKRSGTPAAEMQDSTSKEQKQDRFNRLLKAQEEISEQKQAAYVGKKLRVLVDSIGRDTEYPFSARTEGGLLVMCSGSNLSIDNFYDVQIEKSSIRTLYGTQI